MANRSAPYGTRFSGLFKNDVNGTVDQYVNGTRVARYSSTALTVGNSDPYALPLTDGSNGQVLKTDGSGAVAWAADATGT